MILVAGLARSSMCIVSWDGRELWCHLLWFVGIYRHLTDSNILIQAIHTVHNGYFLIQEARKMTIAPNRSLDPNPIINTDMPNS